MTPHRLRCGALHLSARRSRQSANIIHLQALIPIKTKVPRITRISLIYGNPHLLASVIVNEICGILGFTN
jgi:hypothetical protein